MNRSLFVIAIVALLTTSPLTAATRQEQVRSNSMKVMPFSMDAAAHMFRPDAQGGTMAVVTRQADAQQLALIRMHLRHEAEAFSLGNYADPSSIHGKAMPGLADLSAGARRITVRYADIKNGAQIVFKSRDAVLVRALHRWFAAQVADHGHDAMNM